MEDLQIIELYFSRNEQAITETDRKYGKLCRSIIYNILFSPEECVNDTYLGTWNCIPPARPSNFSAFLCRIARNLSLKRLEYNKAMKRDPEVYVSYSELENVIADDEIDPFIIIKEMNIFQKAAAEGKSVSEVDSAGDFNYTKPDIIADKTVQADSNQNVPEVFSDLKTDMYNKMLNSIDYLNRVKAVAVTNMIGEKERIITYHSDIETGISYQSVMESDTVISETFSNILVGMTEVYHTEKTYVENYLPVYSREDTPYIPLEERIVEGEDGIPCYSYRRNITNCPLASYSIVPQEITFSYLKDFDLWTIENESSTYLDRPCAVICGKPSPYMSSKHQIDFFEMIVDKETGVLLSFSGTYQDTSVVYSKITHIDYEDQETIKSFVKEAYPEYTANRR